MYMNGSAFCVVIGQFVMWFAGLQQSLWRYSSQYLGEITAVLAASTEKLTASTKDNLGIYNKGI